MTTCLTMFVCVTCKGLSGDDPSPGRALLARLRSRQAEQPELPVSLQAVECLSVCRRPCTVALSAPGKWTYVVADLDVTRHAESLLTVAALYHRTEDGVIPWRDRPDWLKKGVVARVPAPS